MRQEFFSTTQSIAVILLMLLIMASCTPPESTSGPISNPTESANTTVVSATKLPGSEDSAQTIGTEEVMDEAQFSAAYEEIKKRKDPVDLLLDLRSISINLMVTRPDNSTGSIHIDIDVHGNMHIVNKMAPDMETPDVPENSTLPKDTRIEKKVIDEILVVDGKSYYPNNLLDQFIVTPWMSSPIDTNYISTLSNILHGKDSLPVWLDRLPAGSLTDAGDENVGGYSAYKYAVKGTVEGQMITGTLWYEPVSGALIKADLIVPAVLYEFDKENVKGQLTAKLETKKSNIPEVKLPAAPVLPTDEALVPTAVPKEVKLPAEGVSSPPVIGATYPVDMSAGMGGMGGALSTSLGKVWLGLARVGIQEIDANTGNKLQTVPLPDITRFWDVKHDGRYLWVLASKENASEADGLYVIDPAAKSVVKEWHEFKDGDYGWQPTRLGLSPGKIWVANKIIDTATLEEVNMGKGFVLPAEARFAYDGQKWMWATGSRCDGCKHDLWMFDSANPAAIKDKDGTGEAGAATMGMPLTATKGKMWVSVLKNIKTVNWVYTSDAYIDCYDLNKTDKPTASFEITGELGDSGSIAALEAGSRFLWLFGSSYNPPTLFYHDLQSGKVLGKLPLETFALIDMAFDGKDLWVLGMDKLIRISQP
jgi:hypothetical protein